MVALGALEIFYMYEHPMKHGWYKTAAVTRALKTIKDFAIIQGRYDVVCPPTTAYDLAQAHPHAKLTMVHYAGHSTREVNNVNAIIQINARLKKA